MIRCIFYGGRTWGAEASAGAPGRAAAGGGATQSLGASGRREGLLRVLIMEWK